MCLHQKNYKHKAAYFTGNQVKFSTPSESPERKSKCIKRVQQWTLFFILDIKEAISEIWWQIMAGGKNQAGWTKIMFSVYDTWQPRISADSL